MGIASDIIKNGLQKSINHQPEEQESEETESYIQEPLQQRKKILVHCKTTTEFEEFNAICKQLSQFRINTNQQGYTLDCISEVKVLVEYYVQRRLALLNRSHIPWEPENGKMILDWKLPPLASCALPDTTIDVSIVPYEVYRGQLILELDGLSDLLKSLNWHQRFHFRKCYRQLMYVVSSLNNIIDNYNHYKYQWLQRTED